MTILAFDSSSKTASVCLRADGRVKTAFFQNAGFTHSKTLMPMADAVLKVGGAALGDVDAFAVSVGPGSFTGLRIGMGTVKGLAWACGKPCAPVSTLEAMAFCCRWRDGTVCCVMDARQNQFYAAMFSVFGGKVRRVADDCALPAEELAVWLSSRDEPVLLKGDGAEAALRLTGAPNAFLAPDESQCLTAEGVAVAAEENGVFLNVEELLPIYLRRPQAERERKNPGKQSTLWHGLE